MKRSFSKTKWICNANGKFRGRALKKSSSHINISIYLSIYIHIYRYLKIALAKHYPQSVISWNGAYRDLEKSIYIVCTYMYVICTCVHICIVYMYSFMCTCTMPVCACLGLCTYYVYISYTYVCVCPCKTSRVGQMSRAPTSCVGRLGKPKIAVSSPEPAGSKPVRVKPMTLKLILVAS